MSATVHHTAPGANAARIGAPSVSLPRVVLAAAVLILTSLSFFRFPGHTILQSDTQIYIPILEHFWDPTTYTRDIMATRPHVAFTFYDETALGLRATTGASFETVLMAQQFVYRAIGIAGLYFLATALGFAPWKALFIAGVISLGATINGPAVLTVEYEPVPRGFALPFLIASMAAVGHRRWTIAAASATVGFAFHPPTAVVYCGLLGLLLILNRRVSDIAVLATGPLLMLVSALAFGVGPERQPIFGRIDPALEQLQRLRGSYNWVSIWFDAWRNQYLLMLAAGIVAFWRVHDRIPKSLTLIFLSLPLVGVLAVPISYVLLEQAKWIFMPQFQPARYLLFVTFVASLFCLAAGVVAAERRRWAESILFLIIAFAIPMDAKATNVLWPDVNSALAMTRLGLAIALAVVAALAVGWNSRPALTVAALLPFMVIPTLGQVRNYAALHHADLDDLARWARQNTPKEAVFQFAEAGRDLAPGVFRARSTRAIYADWKAGGQVNFQKQFSDLWWQRWQQVEKPQTLDKYRELGIDYVVFNAGSGVPAGANAVYSNARYVVFKLT